MAVNSGERALWVSGGVAQSTQCACGARAPAGGRHEAVLARLPATLVCIGRPRGLFDQTSDHSILAGARTASLGGTQLSQTAQPGITAATTALAVEHNSRCAASGIPPQPSPHFPAIRNSISPASIVEVQLRFSTCRRKRVHVI
jgi:hypothetical protein